MKARSLKYFIEDSDRHIPLGESLAEARKEAKGLPVIAIDAYSGDRVDALKEERELKKVLAEHVKAIGIDPSTLTEEGYEENRDYVADLGRQYRQELEKSRLWELSIALQRGYLDWAQGALEAYYEKR